MREELDFNLRAGPQGREYDAIADRIAREGPRNHVLDWGCGYGQMTRRLLDRGLEVTAFEWRPDEPVHKVALERFPEIEAWVSGDPVKLPFEDETFDAALSCGVLEHVQDPDGSLDELRRVLKPGGTLYVYKLPNRFSYLEAVARMMGLYYHGKHTHDTIYTLRGAVQRVARHGFDVTTARHANLLPLTIVHPFVQRHAGRVFRVNQSLTRVPGFKTLATNVEVIAQKPSV